MIGPDDFVSLAEETGLIIPLGYEVLRHSARRMPGRSKRQFPDSTASTSG